jgi:DNA-binding LacI/PurR family transcriptional regulator
LVGGTLKTAPIHDYEYQLNQVYGLIDPSCVDGLIIMGSIGTYCGAEELRRFHSQFEPLPTISVGIPLQDIPSVVVDNHDGMATLVNHLIRFHRFERFAFLRCPEGNPEANQRYLAYVDVLKKNNLPIDDTLIFQGDFLPDSGAAAVRSFQSLEDKKVQAIVAANDNMALGATVELRQRGIAVPKDIAVVGFDDIEEAKAHTPSLTTIRQPIRELGSLAVDAILKRIRGEELELLIRSETQLMVRQSCGCLSSQVLRPLSLRSSEVRSPDTWLESMTEDRRERLLKSMKDALAPLEVETEQVSKFCGRLLDSCLFEFKHESLVGTVVRTLHDILRPLVREKREITPWHQVILLLRKDFEEIITDQSSMSRAAAIWHSASLLISDMAHMLSILQRIENDTQSACMHEISKALVTAFDVERLAEIMRKELPRVGIKRCYVVLGDEYFFHDRAEGGDERQQNPRILLALDEEASSQVWEGERLDPAQELLPKILSSAAERASVSIRSLFFADEFFGFIAFDSDSSKGLVYETVAGQTSSAIKGAALFMRERTMASRLNEAVSELEEIHRRQEDLPKTN